MTSFFYQQYLFISIFIIFDLEAMYLFPWIIFFHIKSIIF